VTRKRREHGAIRVTHLEASPPALGYGCRGPTEAGNRGVPRPTTPARPQRRGRATTSRGRATPSGRHGGGEVGASRGDELLAGGEPPGLVGATHEVVDRLLELLLSPRARRGGIGGASVLKGRRRRSGGRDWRAVAPAAVGLAPRVPGIGGGERRRQEV
jgi:hypothetical protein